MKLELIDTSVPDTPLSSPRHIRRYKPTAWCDRGHCVIPRLILSHLGRTTCERCLDADAQGLPRIGYPIRYQGVWWHVERYERQAGQLHACLRRCDNATTHAFVDVAKLKRG